MSFLTTESLRKIISKLISPADIKNLKRGAYELSLGPEIYITGEKYKKSLSAGEHANIPPGQFALLLTEETISVPSNMIAFISIKADIKFGGLINVSGFHVDPGFTGRLKFSVYNAGSRELVIARGKPMFLIWYSLLDKKTNDIYDGKKLNQMSISTEDVMKLSGVIASPASLNARLKKIEDTIKFIQKFFWYGLVPFAFAVLSSFLFWSLTHKDNKDSSVLIMTEPTATVVLEKIVPASKLKIGKDSGK